MAKSKATAKVQTASKTSLADLLRQKQESASKYRVSIPVSYLLEFDPQNPVTENATILGQPRKVVRWDVQIDGKPAKAVFLLGQVGRLYDSILKDEQVGGVSLTNDAVHILTDKFTVNSRGIKNPNGSAGFLNLSPFTRSNAEATAEVSGFTFA